MQLISLTIATVKLQGANKVVPNLNLVKFEKIMVLMVAAGHDSNPTLQ